MPLPWTPRHCKLSLGAIWNFSKEQGSTEFIRDYGAQRARYIRPRRIGIVWARSQMLINQLYGAGIFSTSFINVSLSKIMKSRSMICALAWNGRRKLVAVQLFCRSCAQAGMFTRVPLPPPTAVRLPHRPENETCCVWKNAAVKQPSVRSLPFETKRFIAAVKKKKPPRFQPLVRASPKTRMLRTYATCHHISNCL